MVLEGISLNSQEVVVKLGDHVVDVSGETQIPEKIIRVSQIFMHEGYNDVLDDKDNDIAVLELSEDADLNVYTPACMARSSDGTTFDGMMAQVYGWGWISNSGPVSNVLLEVDVPVVTNEVCSEVFSTIDEGEICAGGVEGQDSCGVK